MAAEPSSPDAVLPTHPYLVPTHRLRRIVPPWDAEQWERLRGAYEDGMLVLQAILEGRPMTRREAGRALAALRAAAPLLDRYRPSQPR